MSTHLDTFSCLPSVYLCELSMNQRSWAVRTLQYFGNGVLAPAPELTLDANPFPQDFLLSLPITSSGLLFESLIHDRLASSR